MLLLGGALVATSFGWNPFAGLLGPRESPRKEPPTTMRAAPGAGSSATMSPAPSAGSATGSATEPTSPAK